MQMLALLPFIFTRQQASTGDSTQRASLQIVFWISQLVEEHRPVTFSQAITLPEPAVIAQRPVCLQVQRPIHKENQDPYPQRRDHCRERGLARRNNPKEFVDEYGNILTRRILLEDFEVVSLSDQRHALGVDRNSISNRDVLWSSFCGRLLSFPIRRHQRGPYDARQLAIDWNYVRRLARECARRKTGEGGQGGICFVALVCRPLLACSDLVSTPAISQPIFCIW
jgi:hypothetical protein